MLGGDTQDRRVFKLDVKAQGLFGENTANEKNLNDYIKMVSTRGVDLGAVVTRISFDLDASTPKLLFKAHRFITQEEMWAVEDLVKSEEVINLKTVTMATLDLSGDEPPAEMDQHPQDAEPQHEPEQRQQPVQRQQPAQQQRPAQTQTPQRAPRQQTAPATQRAQPVQVDDDVPVPQQPQRAARQTPQQPARQTPAPQQTQRPQTAQRPAQAPAPAPAAQVETAMSDDDLGALLDSLE
jgi:outer membrane biosynthesis protein TonB